MRSRKRHVWNLREADLAQWHPLPASRHVQPQGGVRRSGSSLIVGGACLTPALLDLPTLHLRVLVEPATLLPHLPDDAPRTAVQHTQHAPLWFHLGSFLLSQWLTRPAVSRHGDAAGGRVPAESAPSPPRSSGWSDALLSRQRRAVAPPAEGMGLVALVAVERWSERDSRRFSLASVTSVGERGGTAACTMGVQIIEELHITAGATDI